ncbi:MAG: hypothetical protein ACJAZW_002200 [Maritalea sp.]|jgi:hypothetical protein
MAVKLALSDAPLWCHCGGRYYKIADDFWHLRVEEVIAACTVTVRIPFSRLMRLKPCPISTSATTTNGTNVPSARRHRVQRVTNLIPMMYIPPHP